MKFEIFEFSLVMLLGPAGVGQTDFTQAHFSNYECLSPAAFQKMITAIDADGVSEEAYELLLKVLELRLKHRQLTCLNAPFLSSSEFGAIKKLAKKYHCRLVAVTFEKPLEDCLTANASNEKNPLPEHVIRIQHQKLSERVSYLGQEGFRQILRLKNDADIAEAQIIRKKLRCDLQEENGPFDIIGDVHGCLEELLQLLAKLDYQIEKVADPQDPWRPYKGSHPQGRRLLFVGDFCDRGPDSPGVFQLVMSLHQLGLALCVPGNHDDKLARKSSGRSVSMKHGIVETLEQLESYPKDFQDAIAKFVKSLPSHLMLQNGELIVSHAGLKSSMHNRSSAEIHAFCIYGDTTGKKDEFGLPIRLNWAKNYNGTATIVYGHTPVPNAEWLNNTIDIDTGCVFGGKLTALRFPEKQLVEVPAIKEWVAPSRPLNWKPEAEVVVESDPAMDMIMVGQQAGFSTRSGYVIRLEETAVQASLIHFTKYAVNPRWLLTLPTPYAPVSQAQTSGFLEHPAQVFEHYETNGVESLSVQFFESPIRVIMVVCKDEAAAFHRFGVGSEGVGRIYTAIGTPFFPSKRDEQDILRKMGFKFGEAGIWEKYDTKWMCLECEVRPFSKHAQTLVSSHFEEIQHAQKVQSDFMQRQLEEATESENLLNLKSHLAKEKTAINSFRKAIESISGDEDQVQFVPLQLLATEGKANAKKDQNWHRAQCEGLANLLPNLLQMPKFIEIDLASESDRRTAIETWLAECEGKSMGAIIRPIASYVEGTTELLQAGMIVRSQQYLRMLYGPFFDTTENLQVLENIDLAPVRGTRLRQFAFAVEALDNFVEQKDWSITFQAIFAVIGLASGIADSRLN